MNYVAFSGGKDSTALALRLTELGEEFELLFTPTGNELPELQQHINTIVKRTGKKLNLVRGPLLERLITDYKALPNWRQRWCTRLIKIQPAIAFLLKRPGSVLSVGLRSDEEERVGLYGSYATYRYPLREWKWNEEAVWAYLDKQGVTVPKRTDCAWCYGQRLGEWYRLWKQHPELYEQGAALERQTGYTFRSPGRDTWPASLDELAQEFCKGRVPRGGDDEDDDRSACRVCRL